MEQLETLQDEYHDDYPWRVEGWRKKYATAQISYFASSEDALDYISECISIEVARGKLKHTWRLYFRGSEVTMGGDFTAFLIN